MITTLYLATAQGLAIVSGSGQHWRGRMALAGIQLQCVTVGRFPAHWIYCGTFGQGVLISKDRGVSWFPAIGLANARVTALNVSKAETLYAGTEPGAVFVSKDEGESWQELTPLNSLPSAPTWSFPPRPETNHVQAILPAPGSSTGLYVAVEAGALVRSGDSGQTWLDRVRGGPADTHTLIASPLDSKQLFSAAGDGCFESTDAGRSWQPSNDGLKHQYCWSIAIHQSDPETMLLSASEHAFTAHGQQTAQSFVYRRVGRAPWQLAMEGLASLHRARIPVIAATPSEPHSFFLASNGVIYRSTDTGLHWEKLSIKWADDAPLTRHSLNIAVLQAQS